jgi:hypothetical protein
MPYKNLIARACRKVNERISTMPFLLSHFSPGDKTENRSAQFLAVCWIVRVEFKVHRLRDGFSVSNALLLSQSIPTFIGHNLDKIGNGTVLQRCHLFQFVPLLLTHRQVELRSVLVLFGFCHWQLKLLLRSQAAFSNFRSFFSDAKVKCRQEQRRKRRTQQGCSLLGRGFCAFA